MHFVSTPFSVSLQLVHLPVTLKLNVNKVKHVIVKVLRRTLTSNKAPFNSGSKHTENASRSVAEVIACFNRLIVFQVGFQITKCCQCLDFIMIAHILPR